MVISYGSSIAFVIHSVEGSTIKIFYGISIGIGILSPSLSAQLRDLSIAFAIHSVEGSLYRLRYPLS